MQFHDITPRSPDEVTMVGGAGGGAIRIVDPIIIAPVGPRRPPDVGIDPTRWPPFAMGSGK